MNSKSSNTPSSSDIYVGQFLVLGENKSKPNSANTIGAIKYTDCQDGAYNMPLQEKLPSKEYSKEDILGVERAPFSKMPVLCPGIAKSGNSSSTRPSQYPRQGTNEYPRSHLGPPERSGDVKASFQPGNSSKRKGQVVDDREELMTAAASAHSARQQACSSPLWERMDTIFAPITTEDVLRLQQPRHAELLNRVQSHVSSDERVKSHHADLLNRIQSLVSSDERVKNIIMKASHRTEQSSLEQGLVSSATSFSGSGIAKTDRTVPCLSQRALSALIDEDEIEHLEGIQPEHNSDVNLQSKDIWMDGVSENKIFQSEFDGHMITPSSFSTGEQCQADDGSRLIRESRNCNGLDFIMPSKVEMPVTSSVDCDYQSFSLDDKFWLEVESVGLCPEKQIHQEIKELQEQLHQQAPAVNNELMKIEKAIEHEQGLEKRATEEVGLDKLAEIAYEKMPLRGRITQPSTRNRSKTSTKKDLAFVERTLQRCKEFEDTGMSCFSDPNLQDAMFPAPPCKTNKENIEQNSLIVGSTSLNGVGKKKKGRPSASTSAAGGTVEKNKRKSRRPPSTETEGGNITQSGGLNTRLPDAEQVVSQPEPVSKQDPKSSKGKEKVDDGMLSGASEIISEQGEGVERKRVPQRRYTKRKRATISTLSNSSSVVAPINTEEYLTRTHKQPVSSTTVHQNVAKCGEASAARVKKVDEFFSKDFEKLCMEPDYDILLHTPTGELVGKPEDLKTFLDFLDEDPTMDFTCPLDVPMDNLFDVDAALAKGR